VIFVKVNIIVVVTLVDSVSISKCG